ncbi:SAM-dependent methyltransferase [Micromonospora mirobrigensis]|uniref:O-Methyltransferase involved in polyketide biosynthesis n=1 Tax=Micromonospora mirobrigensis TaxID=262898 RepID=A0A1C4VKJ5_9ACTN|nr:SAM-dependent methyltransferase [Micromonospora mirobrigensis]SCE84299.1 O-Methyltransferase involved in polyketide biosynthesis [Micromonospora mirobrigensis]
MSSEPTSGPKDAEARPNVARMYDYYLGGCHNFAADRAAAEKILEIFPDTGVAAQTNRAFLRRAVRYAAQRGVRQFLDIGAGLPTQGNVHEVVRAVAPDSRVVYVDSDEVAVAYARRLLPEDGRTVAVRGDLRAPDEILADPQVRGLIDLAEPVAVLVVAVLHFVPDADDPYAAVARLRAATVPGSLLALSHLTMDGAPATAARQGQAVYRRSSAPLVPRSYAEVERFFDGYDLVEPGLVRLAQWRPDGEPQAGVSHGYGGVGVRR